MQIFSASLFCSEIDYLKTLLKKSCGLFPESHFSVKGNESMEDDSTVHNTEEIVEQYFRQLADENQLDAKSFLDQFEELPDSIRLYLLERIESRLDRIDSRNDTEFSNDLLLLDDTDHSVLEPTKTLPPHHTPKPVLPEKQDNSLEPGIIGDYELLEQIGKGGMGLVYKARQLSLSRFVALKIIRNKWDDESGGKKLRQEAHAAGKLHHPNIVPIYAFGEFDGKHFFTMQYVDGPSLAQLIQNGPLASLTAAQYLRTMARTIAYSHEQGIVHRDLKPSNVLIDQWGQPCITDFGVARPITDSDEEQKTGYITGTPNYMAPEQSRSTDRRVVPASDIYSLGAVLYALLTGRPPFKAANTVETLALVRNQSPTPPRILNHNIPSDLETICLKCLQKETFDRYLTADELATDLNHFILGEPITARPAGKAERFWRLCQRNPASSLVVFATTILIVALMGILFFSNIKLHRVNQELEQQTIAAEQHQQEAIKHRDLAAQALYLSNIKDAGLAWQEQDTQLLHHYLKRQEPRYDQRDWRGGEWYFLWNHANIPYREVDDEQSPIYIIVFNPAGTLFATARLDAVIRIYDAKTFELEHQFDSEQKEVNGIVFSPDGRRLSSVGDDGTLRIWDLEFRNERLEELIGVEGVMKIQAHDGLVFNVLYNQDGTRIYTAGNEKLVNIWDAKTGEPAGTLKGHTSNAGAIALSPDGKLLASAGSDSRLIVWELDSLSEKWHINTKQGRLTSVAWSHDGNKIVTSSITNRVAQIYDNLSGEFINEIQYMNEIRRAIFSPDDLKLITSDSSGMIRIDSIASNGLQLPRWKSSGPHSWRAHKHRIYALTLSPDKKQLLTGGSDDKVLSWELHQNPSFWFLQKNNHDFDEFHFITHPDGEKIISLDHNRLELWNPHDGSLYQQLFQFETGRINCISASPNQPLVAAGSSDGMAFVLDAVSGQIIFEKYLGEHFEVSQVILSADGSYLAAASEDGDNENKLVVYELGTDKLIEKIQSDKCESIAFSNDSKRLFATGHSNEIKVWDLDSHSTIAILKGHFSTIKHLVPSPDDKLLVSCSNDRMIKTWDLTTMRHVADLSRHKYSVSHATFNRDGSRLISCGEDGHALVWDVNTAQQLFEINYEEAEPTQLYFSEDDRYLVCRVLDNSGKSSKGFIQIMKWDDRE